MPLPLQSDSESPRDPFAFLLSHSRGIRTQIHTGKSTNGGRVTHVLLPKMGLTVLAVLLFILTFSDGALHGSDDPEIVQVTQSRRLGSTERRFRAFLRAYGKEYRTREEYARRLGVFARNLARAAEHQALDPTAVHGVTPFSDLTEEEFEAAFTGLSAQDKAGWPGRGAEFPTAAAMEVGGLPSSFDWRNKGAVTDVKMQVVHNTGTICSIVAGLLNSK